MLQDPASLKGYPAVCFFSIPHFTPGTLAEGAASDPAAISSPVLLQPIQGSLGTRMIQHVQFLQYTQRKQNIDLIEQGKVQLEP